MSESIWRDIPDFPGYQVTRDGRVRGLYGELKTARGKVGLYRKGKQHWSGVEELTARAWGIAINADFEACVKAAEDVLDAARERTDTPAPRTLGEEVAVPDQAELIEELREIIAHLEADLSTVTRQRDKALRQRDALAVTRLIAVAKPRARTRRVHQ